MPLGFDEQTTAVATTLPTLVRTGLPPALVAPSAVGAAPQVEAPASQAEVAATAPSQEQPDAATVVSEGAAQSAPPAAQASEPEVGRTKGDTAGGSSGAVAVVERTSGGSPSALMSGGSRSPMRGEPLLLWMAPQDPTSTLFSLDDAAESMERESLDIGFSEMMDALSQARGVLHDVIVSTGRVSA